ncbi:hypothetical protein ABW21_db0203003 [Orbilia brochopaga]|nr:hypothetical protein ABW21_db0203003 [Drechslerella brochopaga]
MRPKVSIISLLLWGSLGFQRLTGGQSFGAAHQVDIDLESRAFSEYECFHHRNFSARAPRTPKKSVLNDASIIGECKNRKLHVWSKRGKEDQWRKRPPSNDEQRDSINQDNTLYRRAITAGKSNEDKENEVSGNPRGRDRQVQLLPEDGFKIDQKPRTLGKPIKQFMTAVGSENAIVNENSYLLVGRFPKEEPRNLLQTAISGENRHLVVFWKDIAAIKDEMVLSDWLYQCWTQGIEASDLQAIPTLQYVTLFRVASPPTLEIMRIARDQWFGSEGERGRTKTWTLTRNSIEFKSDEDLDVWSALRGTLEVDAVVRMLYNYPNSLQRVRLSQIRLVFDNLEEPRTVDVLLILEQPISENQQESNSESGSDDSENEAALDGDNNLEKDRIYLRDSTQPPSLHPALPDIGRTTYGDTHRPNDPPSYAKVYVTVRTDSTGIDSENVFEIATSLRENHLVFLGFYNDDWEMAKNLVLADRVQGKALYDAWIKRVGEGVVIKDITFATLSPRTGDYIRGHPSLKRSLDTIAIFTSDHPDFERIQKELFGRREGRILKLFMEEYAEELGNPEIYSIEFGRYTSKVRRGEPFLFVKFMIGRNIFERPKTAAESLARALYRGADSVVIMETTFTDSLPRKFITAPQLPDLESVAPGYRLQTFGDTKRNEYYIDCPAEDLLADVYRLCGDQLPKDLPWSPDLVKESRYYGVIVGPKAASDESYMFRLANFAPLKHIILVRLPTKRESETSVPLEDVLFASWLKSHSNREHVAVKSVKGTISGTEIRYVSLLEVSLEAERIIRSIFKRMDRPRSKALVVKYPFQFYRGPNSQYPNRSPLIDKLNWLLLMGISDISSVEAMFLKYRSHIHMDARLDIILIRWVRDNGKERPQIFLGTRTPTGKYGGVLSTIYSGTESSTLLSRKPIDDAKLQPNLRKAAIFGQANSFIHESMISLNGQYNAPMITEELFEFKELKTRVKCSKKTLSILLEDDNHDHHRKMFALSSNSYTAYSIANRDDGMAYRMLISAENRHIDVPNMLPLRSIDDLEQAKHISQVLFKGWSQYGRPQFPSANRGQSEIWAARVEREDPLHLITFVHLNADTEKVITEAWNRYVDSEKIERLGNM